MIKLLRISRWILSLIFIIFCATFAFVVIFAILQPAFEPNQFNKADRIVVLGAGMSGDGTLHTSSKLRVEKAVEIFNTGASSALHFSGGARIPNGVSAGEQMAKYAIQLNVPKSATSYESKSQSTLQNALFSVPFLKDDQRIILVTEGFHLPRSWVSLKLFGDYQVAIARSTAFRQPDLNNKFPQFKMCIRETLAIWFNAGRYLVWKAASLWGMDETSRINLLH